MVDFIETSYNNMLGYMNDSTETYVIDLIEQYSDGPTGYTGTFDINTLSIFSKFGVTLNNFGVNLTSEPLGILTADWKSVSLSASG
jgi:hypothetical protein